MRPCPSTAKSFSGPTAMPDTGQVFGALTEGMRNSLEKGSPVVLVASTQAMLRPALKALAPRIVQLSPLNREMLQVLLNWKGSSEASITRADGKSRMDILHYRAEQGFTRPDPAITPHGLQPSCHAPISRRLWASMIASHGRVVSRRILKGRSRRRLNPLFVGWLMGWPIGHALCACSATEFTLWQQHMRGALSQLPMASGPWIWRPTKADHAQRPAQMTLFEGMDP